MSAEKENDLDLSNRVIMHRNRISNTGAMDVPGCNYGVDDAFEIERFRSKLQVSVKHLDPEVMEFDMVGVDASIANALRRIMIAEVPTMAIKTAYFLNNTSTIPDEMLAHRLGLLPFKADPAMFNFPPADPVDGSDSDTARPQSINDSLVFRIFAECKHNPDRDIAKQSDKPQDKYVNSSVLSRGFYWIPQPGQLERLQERVLLPTDARFADYWHKKALDYADYAEKFQPPSTQKLDETYGVTSLNKLKEYWSQFPTEVRWAIRPLHDDIVVDKLRPGQCVDIQVTVTKGVGRDHAKWSPVCTASYRLLPEIIIKEPITGEDAVKFQKCFPKGVIGIRNVSSSKKEAYVVNPRLDTVSRECLRHEEFKDKVLLTRVRDHFIYTVESVGQYDSPATIFLESCKILLQKCEVLKEAISDLQNKYN